MMKYKNFLTVLCLGLAVTLGCGPEEKKEPDEAITEDWITEFSELKGMELSAPVPRSGTDAELWPELEKLDERVKAMAAGKELGATAEFDELAEQLQQGIHRAALREEPNREAVYRMALAFLYDRMGFGRTAAETLEPVPALTHSGGSAVWGCSSLMLRGDILRKRGDLIEAVLVYAEGVRFGGEHGKWDRVGEALDRIEGLCSASEYRPAMKEAVLPDGELSAKKEGAAVAGYCEYLLKREGAQAALEALSRAEQGLPDGDRVWRAVILSRKGELFHDLNRFGEAVAAFQEAMVIQEALAHGVGVVRSALRLGAALEYRGDPGDAELAAEMYRVAYHRTQKLGLEFEKAVALNYLGLNFARRHSPELSLVCFFEAAAIAAEVAPGSPLHENIKQNSLKLRKVHSVESIVIRDREELLRKATEL